MVRETTGARKLKTIKLGDFQLVNDEKVQRVLDLLDGVTKPNEEELRVMGLVSAFEKDKAILSLYDRLGGGIRDSKDRKIALGSFWDFKERAPKEHVEIKEDDYEDEYVLKRKSKRTKREVGEDVRTRISRYEKTAKAHGIK